jgi:lipoprotein NlpI
LAESVKGADPQAGLAPGVALLLGRVSPEQALQAASDNNAKIQRDRSCAANFQVGEWYLLKGRTDQAREHLSRATALCDKSFPEFAAARSELARLQ